MRKLSLRKEALAELTADELTAVVGGAKTEICLSDPCITPPPTRLDCTFSLAAEVCD